HRSGGTRNGWPDDSAVLSLLRSRAAADLLRPRHVSACQRLPRPRAALRDGAVLPAPRPRLLALLPGSARRARAPGANLQRIRLLLLVLGLVAPSRQGLRGDDYRAPGPRRHQPGGGDRLQRRLP